MAAWTTFGTINISSTWAWRIPSLSQGFPAAVQTMSIWFVPESPRWLIYHNRPDEGYEILKKYHSNGEDTEFVQASYLEIRETIELERSVGNAKWIQLFSSPAIASELFFASCRACSRILRDRALQLLPRACPRRYVLVRQYPLI